MPDGLEFPMQSDESTGCWHWRGPVSSDGYPVWYHDGGQFVIGRLFFSATLVQLPEWARLHRVCASSLCVQPSHHVLATPRRTAERLGYCTHDVRGIAALIRARRQREPDDTTGWDAAQPVQLSFELERMKEWASRLDVPALLGSLA